MNMEPFPGSKLLTVILLALGALPTACSQTVQAANQRIRVQAFGLFTYVRPDFYSLEKKNLGVTLGADIDGFRLLPYTDIGADLRYTVAKGGVFINESSFVAGPRVSFNAYRLKPYGDFLIGIGYGSFPNSVNPDYKMDSTSTYGFGGGFDYQLTRSFSLRADVQRQRWRFTHVETYFHPLQASVGVSYQIHLPSRSGPRY